RPDTPVFNVTKSAEERVGNVFVMRGKTQENVSEVVAGDIGAVAKLAETVTGDTLGSKASPIALPPLEFPAPVYSLAITPSSKADGQLKKQTGGRGQFARCSVELSPRKRGEGYEYEDAIVGGAIPNNFIPSVDKGIRKAMEAGPLAGYPFVDFKAKLYDGKYHTVDSSDIAFQLAAAQAFKDAAAAAGLVLLEPVMNLTVLIPDESVGDVMGDLPSRRQ